MRTNRARATALVLGGAALALLCALAATASVTEAIPTGVLHDVLPIEAIDVVRAPSVDLESARVEDEAREREGLPPRFAIPNPVFITPSTDGTWEDVDEATRLWRLRITSEGALSLNLGFTRYSMPPGGKLLVYASDGSYVVGPYTAEDNEEHGELWTPVVLADDIVVEVTIPRKAVGHLGLELTSINVGYRGFGELLGGGRAPGWCNNDVICPIADGWRDDIRSVGVISTGGYLFCTGFMINNTAQDGTPYFVTANHCGIDSGNDASLVVYWNYESPNCGDLGGGSLADNQTGSVHLASYTPSDITIVRLDDDPDPSWNVTFAGWDRTSNDPTSAVAIHHPDADVKCISFEYDPCTTTSYLGTTVPGDGTHIRVIDWDDGTTEPGSSGSPLFNQNHRVVGQLHGGYAACGNDESDWYGRFSVSWTGAGLATWLDPTGSGTMTLDLYDPNAGGLRVTPSSGFESSGEQGGPFTPDQTVYTLGNQYGTPIDYSVSKTQNWITLTNASGTIPGGGTVDVTVRINSNANLLPTGVHTDVLQFVNETDHVGDTARDVTLQVGVPELAYSFPMDSDPGWTTEGSWAFGHPTGAGGEYGNPDPSNGYTGTNVYGYNLAGDYENSMPERHLTTTAIDCSDLEQVTLKFWRWLGVEQSVYDHAYLRVSNDGSTWTTIWQNGSTMNGGAWERVEYDISSVADGEATVYIRWTMGPTDSSWRYCGWNIDDVEIWGIVTGQSGVDGSLPSSTVLSPNYPNPFGPSTTVAFDLPAPGRVSLKVYDVAGRLVRTLAEATMPAGRNVVTWDGKDDSGERVAAGVYFCRLEAGDRTETRRMVLVK